jgi:hypothetical protein
MRIQIIQLIRIIQPLDISVNHENWLGNGS